MNSLSEVYTYSFLKNVHVLIFEKERKHKQARGRETHTHTESEAGFRLQAVSAKPNVGLEPMRS